MYLLDKHYRDYDTILYIFWIFYIFCILYACCTFLHFRISRECVKIRSLFITHIFTSIHQTHWALFQTLKESTKIYITLIYPKNSKSNSFWYISPHQFSKFIGTITVCERSSKPRKDKRGRSFETPTPPVIFSGNERNHLELANGWTASQSQSL